ncbi:methyl-accepting chemotaxis protein [Burkholderia sp. SCN-KJ]|uniref:methyl-accepting chemotaxis protein n=2 Tax=unclassified Burkholderia TaxID=2613784 RepID=UPI00215051C1|nr:methyl-accepting chemotaxis protein [Burkholderia sp. SCN-KJ]MCR4471857.1 methyl-accepting chemotaxis protein [Burkholderia sp. SCN-KJ]
MSNIVTSGKDGVLSRLSARKFVRPSSWSLRTRLLAVTVLTVLMGFVISISLLTWQSTEAQKASALMYTEQLADTTAASIEAQLNAASSTAHQLAEFLAADRAQGGENRQLAVDFMRRIAEANPDYLAVWTIWEPNAFDGRDSEFVRRTAADDGTGRFVPTWGRYTGKLSLEPAANYDLDTADGDYYRLPQRAGHDIVMEPSVYSTGGTDILLSFIEVPMFEKGKFLGVTGVDIYFPKLQAELERMRPFGTGFISLVSQAGKGIADGRGAGKTSVSESFDFEQRAAVRAGRKLVTEATLDGEKVLRMLIPVPIGKTNTSWSLVVTVPERAVLAGVAKQRAWAAAMCVFSILAVSMLLALNIDRSVLRPMGGEPGVAQTIASRVSAGDLTGKVSLVQGDTSSVMAAMARMQQSLRRIVLTVRNNAESIAVSSTQIAESNEDLSGRTSQQAASVEEASASMEEFAATIQENSSNAFEASSLASDAAVAAAKGGDAVEQVVTTMGRIHESSKEIADIVGLIESIAFQTNILALNAAVEAARAGENGRGFAVVAAEVRNLAARSASASKEIRDLVATNQDLVTRGAGLADEAGTMMNDIVERIQRAAAIVSEISAASAEQEKAVTQLDVVVRGIDDNTQRNAALVEQSAAATQGLRHQAQELVKLVSMFKIPAQADLIA